MTRKDYILIADAFRKGYADREVNEDERAGIIIAAVQVSYALKADNPRFDGRHFLAVIRGQKPLNSRPSRKVVF